MDTLDVWHLPGMIRKHFIARDIIGHVERAQRTHIEEFYEVTDANFNISERNQALLKWENA